MKKKRRSIIVNVTLSAAVIIMSFLMMGAYDESCSGGPTITYSEIVIDESSFDEFYTTPYEFIPTQTVVHIKNGTEATIPLKVNIIMKPEWTLEEVYGLENYNLTELEIYPDSDDITFGSTSRTDAEESKNTSGAAFTLSADIYIPDTLNVGEYYIDIYFVIFNKQKAADYSFYETVYVDVYNQDMSIITDNLTEAMYMENNYWVSLEVEGGLPPYTWEITGLPDGLFYDSDTGEINGIPATVGAFTVSATVTDSAVPPVTASAIYNLDVWFIDLNSDTDAIVDREYYAYFSVAGTAPHTIDISGLPDGLSYETEYIGGILYGTIFGIPSTSGTFNVSLTAADSSEPSVIETVGYELTVYPELTVTTDNLPNGTVNTNYSKAIEAIGGIEPYWFEAEGLPDGLEIDNETGIISGIPVTSGAFTVQITVYDVAMYESSADLTLTINEEQRRRSNSSNNSPVIIGSSVNVRTTGYDDKTGIASSQIDNNILDTAFNNAGTDNQGLSTVNIVIPEVDGAKGYESVLLASYLNSGEGNKNLLITTGIAELTLPDNMLNSEEISDTQIISLTVSEADRDQLDEATQSLIGDRPLIQISMNVDGEQTEWNNESAPVTISIPYTPTEEELNDPEHITVWYIDGAGNVISVPSGRYDPSTGRVTFSTTHFSNYAVVYVQKNFIDMVNFGWAVDAVEILASKGIISGITDDVFKPAANIRRADFIMLLTKTLGLNAKTEDNYDDVLPGTYYYEAVGIAKELDIAAGSGDNSFYPHDWITRQDMMVFVDRALNTPNLDNEESSDMLNQFADKDLISDYAKESAASLISEGLIVGSDGEIKPLSYLSRAEAAVILYKIYNKY